MTNKVPEDVVFSSSPSLATTVLAPTQANVESSRHPDDPVLGACKQDNAASSNEDDARVTPFRDSMFRWLIKERVSCSRSRSIALHNLAMYFPEADTSAFIEDGEAEKGHDPPVLEDLGGILSHARVEHSKLFDI